MSLEKIQQWIAENNYVEADKELRSYREKEQRYDDIIAILDGSIGEGLGDKKRQWNAIRKGLEINHKNYELYIMLGNYYLEENLKKTYLCYENALHYCKDTKDGGQIQELLAVLTSEYQVSVPKAAIVVLSYNLLEYTKQCVESIRENTPESAREIIVVDNASTDGSVQWLKVQKDIKLIENEHNVGFPAGCNQGICLAQQDSDIFLLNNDTILTPNSLFWLRMGLYESEAVGSCGSVSNYVSNYQQIKDSWKNVDEILAFSDKNNLPMEYPYEEKLFLIGFALLIKRSVMDKIGLLDENFSPGNSEDVDYGLRIMQAGYKNLLCKNSFILHFGSKSFGKLGKGFAEVLQKNQSILNRKWGMNLQYYMYPRMELVNLIREEHLSPIRVLDIGCGCGAIMAKIKSQYPNAIVTGIEIVDRAARIAANIGNVICADVENLDFPYEEETFDYCIMGDVLEHLREPGLVLERLKRHMKTGGKIIVSMPNVKHWSVILPLLKQDKFTYEDAGILDCTHLKMYTFYEMQKLIVESGYEMREVKYTSIGEPEADDKKILQNLIQYMDKPDITTYMAYQYILLAGKEKEV